MTGFAIDYLLMTFFISISIVALFYFFEENFSLKALLSPSMILTFILLPFVVVYVMYFHEDKYRYEVFTSSGFLILALWAIVPTLPCAFGIRPYNKHLKDYFILDYFYQRRKLSTVISIISILMVFYQFHIDYPKINKALFSNTP